MTCFIFLLHSIIIIIRSDHNIIFRGCLGGQSQKTGTQCEPVCTATEADMGLSLGKLLLDYGQNQNGRKFVSGLSDFMLDSVIYWTRTTRR